MSIDRRLLNWGVFLVLLGGVPLAVAQGWIPRDVVSRAWELWPVILIGAGVGLILSRTPLHAIGGIVVSGTLGIILGGLLAVGFGGFSVGSLGCGAAQADAPQVLQEQGSFEGGSGRLVLDATCASVLLAGGPGGDWSAAVQGTDDARPTVDRAPGRVALRSAAGPLVFPFTTRRSTWQVNVGTDTTLDIELDLTAADATVDLGGARISSLSLDGNAIGDVSLDLSRAAVDRLDVGVNAADIAIRLPEGADMVGQIEGNAASVQLCAPATVGLRFLAEGNITLSDNYEEQGLIQNGNAWETPGYATAATRVELRTSGNAMSYTLNPEDGCR